MCSSKALRMLTLLCGQQKLPRPPSSPPLTTTVLSVLIGLLQAPPSGGLIRCFFVRDGLSSQRNIPCTALPKHLLQPPSFLRLNSILFCVLHRILFIVPLGGQQGSGNPGAWLTSSCLASGPSWEQPLCAGGVAGSHHPQAEVVKHRHRPVSPQPALHLETQPQFPLFWVGGLFP